LLKFEQQALKQRLHHVVGIAPGIRIAATAIITPPSNDTKNGFFASPQCMIRKMSHTNGIKIHPRPHQIV
jgi:hypothetical protein